jgi:hypothetical protein
VHYYLHKTDITKYSTSHSVEATFVEWTGAPHPPTHISAARETYACTAGSMSCAVLNPLQRVTKRCRLSWLTYSALIYEPNCTGVEGGGVFRSLSQWVHLCAWSPNKLGGSNSIFNIWPTLFPYTVATLVTQETLPLQPRTSHNIVRNNYLYALNQCCGSGSAWIRKNLGSRI